MIEPAVKVRPAGRADRASWLAMRHLLWPGHGEDFADEIDRYLGGEPGMIEQVLVSEGQGSVSGFLELSLRSYAEGADTSPVPYVEGWFVREDCRGQGHGAALISGAEAWARQQGFSELASDAEIDNHGSIAAHNALGFVEQDRVVCFLKRL